MVSVILAAKVFLEMPEFVVFQKGLFSNVHLVLLVVSVVLAVSSLKKKNHPLPEQPPSSTLISTYNLSTLAVSIRQGK